MADRFLSLDEFDVAEPQALRNVDTPTDEPPTDFLAKREDAKSGGTSWERISEMVDFCGKGPTGGAAGSGKRKMREWLMGLRKDENATGAKNYKE
ncbi:hypothetical protein KC316_g7664 [Hortaea werneckii]|nr:hypothetical protein KC324_g7645 [Hortaea werneckii]KAI7582786.1 hypothetical protein KC316_g7664 [Hortaea werneckii]